MEETQKHRDIEPLISATVELDVDQLEHVITQYIERNMPELDAYQLHTIDIDIKNSAFNAIILRLNKTQ